jgi:hypothetical protein
MERLHFHYFATPPTRMTSPTQSMSALTLDLKPDERKLTMSEWRAHKGHDYAYLSGNLPILFGTSPMIVHLIKLKDEFRCMILPNKELFDYQRYVFSLVECKERKVLDNDLAPLVIKMKEFPIISIYPWNDDTVQKDIKLPWVGECRVKLTVNQILRTSRSRFEGGLTHLKCTLQELRLCCQKEICMKDIALLWDLPPPLSAHPQRKFVGQKSEDTYSSIFFLPSNIMISLADFFADVAPLMEETIKHLLHTWRKGMQLSPIITIKIAHDDNDVVETILISDISTPLHELYKDLNVQFKKQLEWRMKKRPNFHIKEILYLEWSDEACDVPLPFAYEINAAPQLNCMCS